MLTCECVCDDCGSAVMFGLARGIVWRGWVCCGGEAACGFSREEKRWVAEAVG